MLRDIIHISCLAELNNQLAGSPVWVLRIAFKVLSTLLSAETIAAMQACIAHARDSGGTTIWCNARLKAADFYRRYGFEARGEVFELPRIGPHFYMCRAL